MLLALAPGVAQAVFTRPFLRQLQGQSGGVAVNKEDDLWVLNGPEPNWMGSVRRMRRGLKNACRVGASMLIAGLPAVVLDGAPVAARRAPSALGRLQIPVGAARIDVTHIRTEQRQARLDVLTQAVSVE